MASTIEIIEYVAKSGKNHFGEWLDKIPAAHAVRVSVILHRMRGGNFGDHKGVGEGVQERRIKGKNHVLRVYYAMDGGELVILLAGGSKAGQDRDIARAKILWSEYKQRKTL